jgi:hypothetical protein
MNNNNNNTNSSFFISPRPLINSINFNSNKLGLNTCSAIHQKSPSPIRDQHVPTQLNQSISENIERQNSVERFREMNSVNFNQNQNIHLAIQVPFIHTEPTRNISPTIVVRGQSPPNRVISPVRIRLSPPRIISPNLRCSLERRFSP